MRHVVVYDQGLNWLVELNLYSCARGMDVTTQSPRTDMLKRKVLKVPKIAAY